MINALVLGVKIFYIIGKRLCVKCKMCALEVIPLHQLLLSSNTDSLFNGS